MSNNEIPNPLANATMSDLLYQHYGLDSIKYIIDMDLHLIKTLDIHLLKNDPVRDKKIFVFRYEVIARFTQLAESLGALIRAFNTLKENKSSSSSMTSDHPEKILRSISDYKVGTIPKFYQNIKTNLDKINCETVFGYDYILNDNKNEIDKSVENIQKVMDEIGDIFLYHYKSYNAYKHGYRIWTIKDYNANIEGIIFRDQYSRGNLVFPDASSLKDFKDKYLITIDDTSLEVINNVSKYCINIFSIIRENNKEIFFHLNNMKQSNELMFKFMNDKYDIFELSCTR